MSNVALLNKPVQARSQATLERLVAAAKRLIETRDWNDISMSEIAAEAKSSVGSLYARFESKKALLDFLDEEYARDVERFFVSHGPKFANEQQALEIFVHRLTKDLVDFHLLSPGLIRALVMETRSNRPSTFTARTQRMAKSGRHLYEAFGYFSDQFTHQEKQEAISWAVFTLWSVTRERTLFPESIPTPGHDDAMSIANQITHTVVAYLTNPAPSMSRNTK